VKLLLHVCCAPCSVACIAALREEGIEPALFWYNPNIHPHSEYARRRDTLIQYAQSLGLPPIMEDTYGLRSFIHGLQGQVLQKQNLQDQDLQEGESCFDSPRRCAFCYVLRMERTALAAREQGFDSFCTTLFISPYQNHELLKETAEAAGKRYGAPLLYRDFRPHFREGQAEARRQGLYMQKYCGCIFSEEERALTTQPQ